MKISVAILVLLAAPALVSASDVAGDRTMTKVVKILQKMMKKSQEDGEKDRTLYAKFKCYCDDNQKDKEEEIAEAKDLLKMLENDINKVRASSSELSTAIAQLKQDINANEAARKAAKQIREDAHDHFLSEEEDMKGALDSMEGAIQALSAITGKGSLLAEGVSHETFMGKKSESDLPKLKAGVKQAMMSVSVWLTQKQRRVLDSFLQTGTSTLQSAAQTGEIVDILKKMLGFFKDNIKKVQSAEKAAEAGKTLEDPLKSHSAAREKFLQAVKEEEEREKTLVQIWLRAHSVVM